MRVAGLPGQDSRHAQDDAGLAAAGEIRRPLRRRTQSPPGPVRRHSHQGQSSRRPGRRRRSHRRGRPPCPRQARHDLPLEIEVDTLDQLDAALKAQARHRSARQHAAVRSARGRPPPQRRGARRVARSVRRRDAGHGARHRRNRRRSHQRRRPDALGPGPRHRASTTCHDAAPRRMAAGHAPPRPPRPRLRSSGQHEQPGRGSGGRSGQRRARHPGRRADGGPRPARPDLVGRAGQSVLLSILLSPPPELCRPVVLTAWAAVAVCATIREIIGRRRASSGPTTCCCTIVKFAAS